MSSPVRADPPDSPNQAGPQSSGTTPVNPPAPPVRRRKLSPENAKRIRSLVLLAFVCMVIGVWVFLQGYGCGYKTWQVPGQPIRFDYPANYTVEPHAGEEDAQVPEIKGTWTASGGGAITGFTVVRTCPAWKDAAPAARQAWIDRNLQGMLERIQGKVLSRAERTRLAGTAQHVEFQGTVGGKEYYFVVEFCPVNDDLYTLIIEGSDPRIVDDERGAHFFESFAVLPNPPTGSR